MDRRSFLALTAGAALDLGLRGTALAAAGATYKLSIFTKHLQFLKDYDALAGKAAELGYDALDLTVREKGHVLPANVERDLPRAFEAARKAGLAVEMITTGIQDAGHPATEPILKTAASLGIKIYRIGGWSYGKDKPIPERLAEIQKQLQGIVEANAKHGLCAVYQNHSGANDVGAPLWDLWEMLKPIPAETMGVNYDLGHATVEGGNTWSTNYRLLANRIRALTFKDFRWEKDEKKGWKAQWCPIGEGMIRVPEMVSLMRESGFAGPITLHFEYEPKEPSRDSHDALFATMKRDAATMKKYLAAG